MNVYQWAKEKYAARGVDTEAAIKTLQDFAISMHCWQGDDVIGFDSKREGYIFLAHDFTMFLIYFFNYLIHLFFLNLRAAVFDSPIIFNTSRISNRCCYCPT